MLNELIDPSSLLCPPWCVRIANEIEDKHHWLRFVLPTRQYFREVLWMAANFEAEANGQLYSHEQYFRCVKIYKDVTVLDIEARCFRSPLKNKETHRAFLFSSRETLDAWSLDQQPSTFRTTLKVHKFRTYSLYWQLSHTGTLMFHVSLRSTYTSCVLGKNTIKLIPILYKF